MKDTINVLVCFESTSIVITQTHATLWLQSQGSECMVLAT